MPMLGGRDKTNIFGKPDIFDMATRPMSFQSAGPIGMPSADPSSLAVNTPRIKPRFFDEGGTGRTIAGVLSDTLMTLGGGQPFVGPQLMRQRELERLERLEESRHQRNLEDEFGLFRRKAEFERTNPKPVQSEFDRALIAAGIDPASEEGRRLYRQRATNMADPFQSVPFTDEQGNSGIRFIRPSQMGPVSAPQRLDALPPGAVPLPQGGAGSGQRPFP